MGDDVKQSKETLQAIHWLLKYIPGPQFFAFLCVYTIKVICEFLIPAQVGIMIDQMVAGSGVLPYLKILIFLIAANICLEMVCNLFLVDVQAKPTIKIQEGMLRHLFELGIPYYENSRKGEVFSLFNTTIANVKNIYQETLPVTVKNLIQFLCLLCLFIRFSGGIGLVIALFLVPGVFVQRFFSDRIADLMKRQLKSRQAFDTVIYNAVSAVREIRSYQCEPWQQKKVLDAYGEYRKNRLETIDMRFKRGAYFRMNIGLGLAVYLFLAVLAFLHWGLSVGAIVTCTYYCTNIMYVFNGIVYNYTELLPELEYVRDIQEFLKERPRYAERKSGVLAGKLKNGICLRDVTNIWV